MRELAILFLWVWTTVRTIICRPLYRASGICFIMSIVDNLEDETISAPSLFFLEFLLNWLLFTCSHWEWCFMSLYVEHCLLMHLRYQLYGTASSQDAFVFRFLCRQVRNFPTRIQNRSHCFDTLLAWTKYHYIVYECMFWRINFSSLRK